jgi:hypothetical protein
MAKQILIPILLLLLLIPPAVFSQAGSAATATEEESLEPEPYTEEEFPPWVRKLRRGEIILIGSFPFAFFLSNIGTQFYMYAARDFAPEYSPSLAGGLQQAPYTDEERSRAQLAVIISAISLSATVALADFIIGEILEKREAGKAR